MIYKKNSHCSYCGNPFAEEQSWPRLCSHCGKVTYSNPLPVSVILLPVDSGLLVVRRAIEPKKGFLALPGGFIGMGESWQEAGAREVFEETGIRILAQDIEDFRVLSAPDGTLLVFGLAPALAAEDLPDFIPNAETSEILVIDAPQELAFSLHTQVIQEYFTKNHL
jgi:ADP-ribose pyrophosphatase YjhB (NUDIX family)